MPTEPDPGGLALKHLEPIRPVLITGPGLDTASAGQVWHWFDTYLERPLVRMDWQLLPAVDLTEYTHVILPNDGGFWGPPTWNQQPEWVGKQLEHFVANGGILVGIQAGAAFAAGLEFDTPLNQLDSDGNRDQGFERRNYGEHPKDSAERRIGGALLEMEIDHTHPLGFGYDEGLVTVMRQGDTRLAPSDNPYAMPGRYSDDPVASGFLSDFRSEQLAGSPALISEHRGDGQVLLVADDYLFRGYHAGTFRLFANLMYFSQITEERSLPD